MAAGMRSTGRLTTRNCSRMQLIPGSTETRLWRIDVESGRAHACDAGDRTALALERGAVQRGRSRGLRPERPRGRTVTRVWKGDLASANLDAVHRRRRSLIEAFSVSPTGGRPRRRRRSRRDERAAVRRRVDAATPPRGAAAARRDLESCVAPVGQRLAIEFAGARTFSDVYRHRREERTARAVDGERDGRREPGLAAGCRDRRVEELRRPDDPRHPL